MIINVKNNISFLGTLVAAILIEVCVVPRAGLCLGNECFKEKPILFLNSKRFSELY
ncbi:MAG: hypothetical protein ACJAZ4_002334 [Neptuniibacter pectenicola]